MVFDQDRRLMLTVDFDGPWEVYIRRIVTIAGPVLDAILCHCEHYEHYSTDKGFAGFARWVRMHQEDCEFFYSASPYATIDDQSYLRDMAQAQLRSPSAVGFDHRTATQKVRSPQAIAHANATQFPADYREQGFSEIGRAHV